MHPCTGEGRLQAPGTASPPTFTPNTAAFLGWFNHVSSGGQTPTTPESPAFLSTKRSVSLMGDCLSHTSGRIERLCTSPLSSLVQTHGPKPLMSPTHMMECLCSRISSCSSCSCIGSIVCAGSTWLDLRTQYGRARVPLRFRLE